MAQLFGKGTIQAHIVPLYEFDEEKVKMIQNLFADFKNGLLADEVKYKEKFNKIFFGDVLGYEDRVNRIPEGSILGVGNADLILGNFTDGKENADEIQVVVELKGCKTNLTKKQYGHGGLSPVGQGFAYKTGLKNCKWLIVSNFYEIRLYRDNQTDYEVRNLDELLQADGNYFQLRKLCLLLHRVNLLNGKTEALLSQFREEQKSITVKFYKEYKALRIELINDIKTRNPDIYMQFNQSQYAIDVIIEKVQKIIDRLIFIFFCEDKGLLPDQRLKESIVNASKYDFTPWEIVKKFFDSVDQGSEKMGIPDGYNGGLFKSDEVLNGLKVGNQICKKFVELTNYDFDDTLSVNILGHIFEQSITDLEELKSAYAEQGAGKGRRKKDGIFYTPEYIVDYIVQNSVMKYLNEKEDECLKKHSRKKDRETLAYQEYSHILQNIKVLDPACGSGAFLVRVFDVLLEENERVGKILNRVFDTTELYKDILTNNIYGVDLNAESVEITKLSLRLKSAQKGKKLTTLDGNIRCGNSLIDDPFVAGKKAFDWNVEFREIMKSGGFDVIVGNPPYFNIQTFGLNSPDAQHIQRNYPEIRMDKSDILFYFFGKALQLCKGKIGYITSNAFLFSDKAQKLRNYLLNHTTITKIVNFEQYQIFQDASITSCITLLDMQHKGKTEAVVFKEKNYSSSELSLLIDQQGFPVNLQHDKVFALIDTTIGNLNQKIDKKSQQLGTILKVGKGMETALNEVFLFTDKPSFPESYLRKRLNGEAITRYFLDKNFTDWLLFVDDKEEFDELDTTVQQYLQSHKEKLENRADKKRRKTAKWRNYSFPMHKEYYQYDKLWCSYRSKENAFVFDDTKKYIGLTNTTVIFGTNSDYNLKYILVLLNSRLLDWRYKSIGKQTGSGVFEYFENGISKLPIKKIPLTAQQPFIEKADQMLTLNKSLHEEITKFLKRLTDNFPILKSTKKLETFSDLTFSDLLAELKKQKISLSLIQQDEREPYFTEKKEAVRKLKGEIETIDREIDEMVFELYGLSEEERKVVMGVEEKMREEVEKVNKNWT